MLAATPHLLASISAYDGGLAGGAGTQLLHGSLPYRDFWWLYGPGAPVVAALFTMALGPSLLLLRILGLALVAVQAGCAYGFLTRRAPHIWAGLIAIGATVLSTYFIGLDLSAWSLALTLALAGLVARDDTRRGSAIAGLLIGAAFATRFDVGAYAFIAGLLLPNRRPFAVGMLAIAVPTVTLALAWAGPVSLYEQIMWFPVIGTREFRALPIPEVDNGARFMAFAAVIIGPKLAIAAGAARVLRGGADGLVAALVFAALCQLQTLGRADFIHQAQAALPAYIVLGLTAGPTLQRRIGSVTWRTRLHRLSVFGSVSILVATGFVFAGWSVINVERGPMPADERALVSSVRTLLASTVGSEPVYVGLTSHRFTLANDVIVYYLADRRSGVQQMMFNPGVTNTDRVQQQMIDDLVASGTAVILLDGLNEGMVEQSNRSAVPGSERLDEFIARTFVVACEFGPFRVMARPDRAPMVRCVEGPDDERLVDILGGLGADP